MLWANEIFPIRRISRNSKLDAVLVPAAPGILGKVRILVTNTLLMNLEPLAIALVGLDRARSLGHVHRGRTWVLYLGAGAEFHGQLGSGLDLLRAGLVREGEGALVAAEVGQIRRHVITGVFPLGGVVLFLARVGPDVLQ